MQLTSLVGNRYFYYIVFMSDRRIISSLVNLEHSDKSCIYIDYIIGFKNGSSFLLGKKASVLL